MDTYSIYPKQFNNSGLKIQSDSCFVVMPFSEDLNNTYMVIESVASSMKIKCTRADKISTTSEPILNKICTQISQAYFIIVDITNLNPNVFYELGIAHVLRDANKVLIIKEEQTTCPSDIQHLHYYAYSKSNLKRLKDTIEGFFSENNILEDLHGILRFLDLLPRDSALSQKFIVSISDHIGNNMDDLILILNNKVSEVSQIRIINILTALTGALNELNQSNDMYVLYSDLTQLIISKTYNYFDLSSYTTQIFNKAYHNISNEWIAECSILFMDNPVYFDSTVSWIVEYLKQSSPAAFDVAKYKIEIGIIKSKSSLIDSVLVNGLKSENKTLVEHCAKLIKERNTYSAIPVLTELIKSEENPYVVRSCIDALVKIAPLKILLDTQNTINQREKLIQTHTFFNKHLTDLENQIEYLQNASNY